MHKKIEHNDTIPSFSNPVLNSLSEILSLKSLFRQGWIQQGVAKDLCESVADHSYSAAMMAWMLAMEYFPELDAIKVLQLAMVHEIGEVYAGDITPRDAVPPADKHEMELESVNQVLGKIACGSYLMSLWDEFETGKSAEAEFVRQIDKLEMAFQALHYEKGTGLDLSIFLEFTDKVLIDEKLRKIFVEMKGSMNYEVRNSK